jgi:phospholipid/cholesterol/gamma-HCH transport system substrate-binding protein
MVASRRGLVLDPGSKVTYNGVEIGRDGKPAAKLVLELDPKYIKLVPANVQASITATTVFGNKYVSFTAPKNPRRNGLHRQRILTRGQSRRSSKRCSKRSPRSPKRWIRSRST